MGAADAVPVVVLLPGSLPGSPLTRLPPCVRLRRWLSPSPLGLPDVGIDQIEPELRFEVLTAAMLLDVRCDERGHEEHRVDDGLRRTRQLFCIFVRVERSLVCAAHVQVTRVDRVQMPDLGAHTGVDEQLDVHDVGLDCVPNGCPRVHPVDGRDDDPTQGLTGLKPVRLDPDLRAGEGLNGGLQGFDLR